jgi:hypothetical protein
MLPVAPGAIMVLLSPAALLLIEQSRGADDVSLMLELQYSWQEATRQPGGDSITVGRVFWDKTHLLLTIRLA